MIAATDVYWKLEHEFNSMKGTLGALLGFLAVSPIFAFLVGGFVMPEFVSFVSDPVPYMDIADLISTSSLYSAIGVLGVFALLLFFGNAVPKEKRLLWFFVLLLGNHGQYRFRDKNNLDRTDRIE